MTATPESRLRTRAFARVIGPFLVLVPGIIAIRAPELGTMVGGFFENGLFPWITGALLLICGLIIIAHHQYWSDPAAVLISLFGWFLALRGFALLAFPLLYEEAADVSMGAMGMVRAGFCVLVLIGLFLTYTGWITQPPKHST
jgi:hypothetical protein